MRFVLVLALVACGRDATPKSESSDALWALTPSGARGGIVLSGKGVAMLERGYAAVRTMIETVPDLAAAKAQLTEALGSLGTNLTLADFGFTPTKGAALFMMKDGMVAILPLGDRDKFLAKVNGIKGDVDKPQGGPSSLDRIDTTSCKIIREHYVCASEQSLLETIGNGSLQQHLVARGEIEIVGAELPFGTPPMTVAAAVELSRGAAVLRATVTHMPAEVANKLAQTATPKLDPTKTSGFALIDLRAWLPASEEKLVGEATVAKALASLDGLLSVTTPAGLTVLNVEQPLDAVEPLATIVANCAELPGAEAINATSTGGVCRFKAPSWDVELDMWLDGKTLRIGKQQQPVAANVPLTPIAAELAKGPWSLLFWGRGTMLAGPPIAGVEAVDVPPESAMVIRLMALVTELGLGARQQGDKVEIVGTVRTIFSNPDDVVSRIAAITAKDIAATRARALAEPIARSAPSSPFAQDFAAGHAGLLVPTAISGQLVSMVVSALMLMRQQELPAPPQ
jgi:hypothetical protein